MLALIRISIFAISLSTFSSAALAHASIVAASPADQSKGPSPSAVEINFNEIVNLAFSRLTLRGEDGALVLTGALTIVPGGKGLIVPIKAKLPEGLYSVEWTVLSSDGHKLKGKYNFTVIP
ncbi:MAG: copper homeostasis periplasmic binding protein CopC [Pseudomonadota bacterium]